MAAERMKLMYEVIPINEVLSEMVERYGFSRDGGGEWIAGVWRGFPVLISLEDVEEINSLEVTMGLGEELPTKDSLRAVHASSLGAVDVDLFPKKGFLRFTVRIKKHVVRETDKALGFLCLLLNAVADSCDPPSRTCGWCGERETDELTLDRGTPKRMCGPCWDAYSSDLTAKQAESPDYGRGMILGIVGAVMTGAVWGFLLYIEQFVLFFLFTPFVGIIVARMVVWGAKRGGAGVSLLAGVFSLLAGVFGILLSSVLQVHALLGVWDVQRALGDLILRMSENRGEVLVFGVLICFSSVEALFMTKELFKPTLERIGVSGFQAEERKPVDS